MSSELKVYEGGLPVSSDVPIQQMRTQFATAMSVQRPRELPAVEKRVLTEAAVAGERFFYGWGAGKDRIEGGSIDLAMCLVRNWGNCAVEMQPIQETADAWVFTASLVDLETGFTLSRQFRQSKRHVVHGKHDEARKEDIRFQIGQSKAIRNVVLNALPKWLADKAIEAAKDNVIELVNRAIATKGLAEIQRISVERLTAHGVTPDMILLKFGRPTIAALTPEDLVVMRADNTALHEGQDTLENLYSPPGKEQPNSSSDAAADPPKSRTQAAAAKAVSKSEKPAASTASKATKPQTLGTDFAALEDAVFAVTTEEQVKTLRHQVAQADLTDSQRIHLDDLINQASEQIAFTSQQSQKN